MKKIITAIIILIILIIATITGLLFLLKNPQTEPETTDGDIGLDINFRETKVESVTDNIDFFTIQNNIQGYLNATNMNNSGYYNNYGEQIVTNSEIATNIYNLLSKEYISENSITVNNVLSNIETTSDNLIFVPLKMNYLWLQNSTKYAVYGVCINWKNEYVKDIYFKVNVDDKNKTYSITPLNSENVKSIDDIKLDRIDASIDINNNNKMAMQNITDQYLCQQYFLIQKRLMLARPELSYEYIDEEYRSKRFGNIENYLKYISENKEHILKMALRGYDVERVGDKAKYMCKDQYENYYLFNVEKVLDYKILLDIYTVEQEKAITAYARYNDRQKIAYNVNKWVQMINNKDYQNAYDVLNVTFRNNNWPTVNDFENYIKQNYPSNYKLEYSTYDESGENAIQAVILKDFDGKEADKNLTIIMKLKEDMNYEMAIAL